MSRRGWRPGGHRFVRRRRWSGYPGGVLERRSVVDYGLARRATLAGLRAGRVGAGDACDAHPYLLRAARFHGERAGGDCPVCRREPLVLVSYVYGDQLRDRSGQVRVSSELAAMAQEYGEFAVYVVEVCRGCGWNHLTTSFVLGHGRAQQPRTAARARPRASGARPS